ncbi:MAG: energy transducer TonB [Hydrocarboniphaga sp.]|uniref:energy transducer TonB n=1 Tax=Hydrocarboniphaga sp. TaxID=2033016 RepID=UPI0026394513|nr:TonB family protein [Hydrocarboniphaga sp.]MDB5972132.1 energy transducer TonB [Hydrocarboniphaga sp.]
MAAAPLKPMPSRLSLAFAAALTLHVLAALTWPGLYRLLGASAAVEKPAPVPPPLPREPPTTPSGEVIAIRLPLAGFQMQTELGAVARNNPRRGSLPSAAKAPVGKFAMSASLGAAAGEALAADRRTPPMQQPPETAGRVTELRLARTNPARPTASPTAERNRASADTKPGVAAPIEPAAPPASTQPSRARSAAPTPAETSAPPPPIQQPIRPPAYPSVQPYRGAAEEKVAVAPPLPPAGPDESPASPPPTAGNALSLAAPDRGPGEPSGERGQFFQKLTEHLFQVNQQVLAEAIRATPRLTVEVRFTIDRSGRVLDVQVVRSTGDPVLDRKAGDVILRASPVPQMAADMPLPHLELSFPVQIYR